MVEGVCTSSADFVDSFLKEGAIIAETSFFLRRVVSCCCPTASLLEGGGTIKDGGRSLDSLSHFVTAPSRREPYTVTYRIQTKRTSSDVLFSVHCWLFQVGNTFKKCSCILCVNIADTFKLGIASRNTYGIFCFFHHFNVVFAVAHGKGVKL